MRRRDDGAPGSRPDARHDQHPERPDHDRSTGAEREQRPHGGPDGRDAHTVAAVAVEGQRYLDEQHCDRGERHEPQRARVGEVEVVADVGEQHPERRSVELVDGVQAEEDDERVGRSPEGDRRGTPLVHPSPAAPRP